MNTLLKTVGLAAMLAFTAVAVAANPVVGTWQLNPAKSKFSPGPAPKTDTRTYTESADGITMTWKSAAADGKEINVKSTFKTDGKDYPVTRTVSKDGKELTLSSKGTGADGVAFNNVMVYDRK
jgi:hypothetical protein